MIMRRYFLNLIALLYMAAGVQGAKYQALPEVLDGSMTLYDFEAVEPSAIPDSLTPIYINYIARHGARYLTSESKVKDVEKALDDARGKGSLTRAGLQCLELMQEVRKVTAGQWGMLSPVGVAQEHRLAREMGMMYPEIFKGKTAKISSASSYVPRVIETMDQFTIGLADQFPGIYTSSKSGRKYDSLTRFFVTDKDYNEWRENGAWNEVYDDFTLRRMPEGPALRLVGDKSGLSSKQLKRLSYDLYKVLQGLRAMGMNPPSTQWMTEEEYRTCWEATNMEKYFRYSISPLSTEPARGARQVLYYLIKEQASLMETPSKRGLNGIFGHAETLLPVYALIGVPGTTAMPLDYDNLSAEWSDAVLTPLAANLEIIYSISESGMLYASMRLNGRNVSPVNDPQRLCVPILELQRHWLSRASQML